MVRSSHLLTHECHLRLVLYDSFSDRDTLMRYHWGMGVGHIHAHGLAEAEALPPLNSLLQEVDEQGTDPDPGEHLNFAVAALSLQS